MYRIIISPCYLQGTYGAVQEHFLTTDEVGEYQYSPFQNEIAEFETKDEAQEVIDRLQAPDYYLRHGEYSRPIYQIVSEIEDPDCLSGKGENFSDYEEVDPADIPAEIKKELDEMPVDFYLTRSDHDVYTASYKGYLIAYCPKSILTNNQDLFELIDWVDPGYYKECE